MSTPNRTDLPPAVVVGLSPTGLGTIRALARSGIRVIGVDGDLAQPSARTRYCAKTYRADINSASSLLEALPLVAREAGSRPVLFFSADMPVAIASANHAFLEHYYHLLLPDGDVVDMLLDKGLFTDFALRHHYAIPKTLLVDRPADIPAAIEEIGYPCLLKPSFRDPEWDRRSAVKAFKVDSAQDFILLKRSLPEAKAFLIQDWIPGTDGDVYFCLLCCGPDSTVLAAFTGRKLKQWLPGTGSTCIAETCECEAIREETSRLFRQVNYRGLGSLEFKRDPRDGSFRIIEPTVGRPDLQSALAVAAGVNLPLVAYCAALGLPLPRLRPLGRRVTWIHEENLLWLMKDGGDSRGMDWAGLARSRRSYALFDWRDPQPFLLFIRNMAGRALRR